MEVRQIPKPNDSKTCGRKINEITTFECDICVDGVFYEMENHDGYFDYQQKRCYKCNGIGVVDWVANLCYKNK